MLFLLLAVYYQDFMKNQEGIKIELQKKVRRRICVTNITFLTARPPFYVPSYSLPYPKWRTYAMAPININNVAMGDILW